MAAQALALRAIVYQTTDSTLPAQQLLNDLGHDVAGSSSQQKTIDMLEHGCTDLLVVDADQLDQDNVVAAVSQLPAERQPKDLAIFSDATTNAAKNLSGRLRSRVHYLMKPLHMHGLLQMLRQIEAKN